MPRIRYKLIGLLALVLIAVPLLAQAATPDPFGASVKGVFEFFALILTGLQAALWPVLLLLGGLLNNDLLFSGGMQTMLLNIWTAIRDFVNILFVLGLLFVAVYNIIGLAPDDYSIPKVLPKIALGLIAVNFSFLMCKVVLDVVNVTTTAIFAVPLASTALEKYKDPLAVADLSGKVCGKIMNMEKLSADDQKKNPYCCPSSDNKTCDKQPANQPAPSGGKGQSAAAKATFILNDAGKAFFSTFNSRNAAMVMAIELMEIPTIDNVPTNVDGIKALGINAIFSLIFLVIYATAFIALFATMLVRVIVLWISIVLMPLSFIGIAFGSKAKEMLGKNDPLKLFFDHALVPVKVAVVLTIGMIMITQLKQMVPGITYSTDPKMLGAITSNMSSIQSIMAGLATAAFIWVAAFAAMENTKASGFVEKYIKNPVQEFGMNVAKLPLYAPIIPTGKAGKSVGLAFLGATAAGGGGLKQFINKKDQEYAAMTGNREAAALKDLEGATTAKEAERKIATLIVESNHNVNEAGQQQIAAQIAKYPELKNSLVAPGGMTMAAFLEALKKGEVKEGPMKEFMEKNKTRLVPTDEARETAQTQADQTVKKAATAAGGTAVGELTGQAKELDDANKALKNNKDPNKTVELRRKVEDLTKRVDALAESRNTFDATATVQNIATSANPDGTIKDSTEAGKIKSAYDNLSNSLQTDASKAEVRKSLVSRVKQALSTPQHQLDDAAAEKIVDNILQTPNQSAPGATAAAPANTAQSASATSTSTAAPANTSASATQTPAGTTTAPPQPAAPGAPPAGAAPAAPTPPRAP